MSPDHSHHGQHRPGRQRRPTIHDVARDAGISKTSVSRYFGAERALLSESMRTRIEASIERLGFRPDRIASSLRGRRTGLIGMLVADMRNPYTVAMVHGAELACRENRYSLVVCNTDSDDALEQRHLEVLQGYSIEGLIVHTPGHNAAALSEMLKAGLPMVQVDRRLETLECDMVGLDNEQAMSLAVGHLAEQGYHDILMISEPTAAISSRETRLAAFQHEVTRHALTGRVHQQAFTPEPDTTELDRCLASFLADAGHHRRAILCANGVVTLAVCQALYRHCADPFAHTGLMGIDELDWCALVGPGITTIAQPVGEIGRLAFERLLNHIEGGARDARDYTFPATLYQRGSTPGAR
ncbi:LacI family transcriptional regulator [Kushneria sinocarnis]|uniref:LacI family transcriptional regulator n=1 Tax=Kushneria sinocarnis TaxID=595502 RepID=A0A420WVP3_9GAMM|nr:substrate-binding domain-containing protein [Kushneria sinocarnis]RKR02651.1 LacI family transcriptional regulator [Kushneria sinocarnis]